METGEKNIYSRFLEDFLDNSVAEKAGIIQVRMGASEPVPYSPSFTWPHSLPITGLEYDSRNIKPGFIYFALPGLHTDGHYFIPEALKLGAQAVIHQEELAEYSEGTLFIKVKNSRIAMSPVADAFHDFPSRRMGIIGVTGTEGKSTTVYLIYQLLRLLNKKTGFISTVMQSDGVSEKWNSEHQTTPEALILQRLLAGMIENGVEYAVLESSSHGLSKMTNRLGDVDFDIAVLTNLTHEHLEFHGNPEQYRNDKAELFRSLDSSPSSHRKQIPSGVISVPAFAVVNADDPNADFFAAATEKKTLTFSTTGRDAGLSVKRIESGKDGNSYDVVIRSSGESVTIKDRLPGAFNAGNVLAALLVVSNLFCVKVEDLIPLVQRLKPVRGRMTPVNLGQPFEVIVDYAHTPSSFEAVLPPLRKRLDSSGGRLICLFGSPGERDTQKRSLQGKAASLYSDYVILTDEDPRGEEPMAILEEIAQGCEAEARMIRDENLFLMPDRPLAIRKAFSLAREGDIVLLLGKGHENSIIYKSGPIPYDEISEAEKALKEIYP